MHFTTLEEILECSIGIRLEEQLSKVSVIPNRHKEMTTQERILPNCILEKLKALSVHAQSTGSNAKESQMQNCLQKCPAYCTSPDPSYIEEQTTPS